MASKAIPKICSEEQPKIPTSQVVDQNACRAPSLLIPKASKSEPAPPRNFPKTIQNSSKAATEVLKIRKVNHHQMGSADSIHDKAPTKIVQSPDLNLLHGGSKSFKQSNQQGDYAENPPVILEVIGNQETKDSDPSSASAKVSDGISSLTKTSGSTKHSDLVESGKSSMCRASTSSDVSDESSCSSFSSRINKPHLANDSRSEAIQDVCAKDGMLGLNHFRLLRRLGCGDISSVYLSELCGTKCYFAMKVMDKGSLASRKKLLRAQTEREILQCLDHPFLPTLYTHFETDKFSCLVMEFCPGGDLHALRQRQPGKYFSEQAVKCLASRIIMPISCMMWVLVQLEL